MKTRNRWVSPFALMHKKDLHGLSNIRIYRVGTAQQEYLGCDQEKRMLKGHAQ